MLSGGLASFIQAFVKIGHFAKGQRSVDIAQALAPGPSSGQAMAGGKLDAANAQMWGATWHAIDDYFLRHSRTLALAQSLAAQPTQALAAVKRESATSIFGVQLSHERDLQCDLGLYVGEGSFLEERDPRFSGT